MGWSISSPRRGRPLRASFGGWTPRSFRRQSGARAAGERGDFATFYLSMGQPSNMVMKKDGSWRPCGDFRRLNLVTESDTYPLPNMLDFSARVPGCKVFSKIDLRKGYYQIPVPMHPADIRKTVICTPFGLSFRVAQRGQHLPADDGLHPGGPLLRLLLPR
jgi:hypothetical protein